MSAPPFTLIATSAFGLEAIVGRELTDLGYAPERIEPGRIFFRGDETTIARANLWLRCADRVLVQVGTFAAPDFDALFDQTQTFPWEQWIPRDGTFPVRGKSVKSQLSSVPACQRTVKKAVVQRLMRAHHVTTLPETGAEYRIEVALLRDRATLTLDTSGVGLHKRGYRTRPAPAPIKETLAAGLIQLTFWRANRLLLDPFCGSGTIPIEAAMIAQDIAPGIQRSFAAEAWAGANADTWKNARIEARDRIRSLPELAIVASDIDPYILADAEMHAKIAGVDKAISFQTCDFIACASTEEYGVIITNPPYGERLEDRRSVEPLYARMPLLFSRLPSWSFYVITPHPNFEKLVGRPADRRRKLYNGRLACTYFQYHGPRPPKSVAPAPPVAARGSSSNSSESAFSPSSASTVPPSVPAPVTEPGTSAAPLAEEPSVPAPAFASPLPPEAEEQAAVFIRRLQKRIRHLRRWPTRQGITCFRLYDQDVPGFPFIIDRYHDFYHVTEHLSHSRYSPAEHQAWLALVQRLIREQLGEQVIFKSRDRQKGKTQHEKLAGVRRLMEVTEGGLRFLVNLTDYIDTGLFLDHRITRDLVRKMAEGRDVLNLYAYTGSFTVYAAAGKAASTTSVDLSRTYLDWAEKNLKLNQFHGPNHRLVRSDVLDYLRRLPAKRRFDLVIVDPPTFSNSKSHEHTWDVQRDHAVLFDLLIPHVSDRGTIFFSTNFRRFRLDHDVISRHPLTISDITAKTIPPDFRDKTVHRCWRFDLTR